MITSNCTNIHFYYKENRAYDHPMIGMLFVIDSDYVKFCKDFWKYMEIKPLFGNPKENSLWAIQNNGCWYKHPEIKTPYPVMFLDDIEIHWIHEESEKELLEKYKKRRDRLFSTLPPIIFLWGEGALCNENKDEEKLIKDFISIPNSLFITGNVMYLEHENVAFFSDWFGKEKNRDEHHILNINYMNQASQKELFAKMIKLHVERGFVITEHARKT